MDTKAKIKKIYGLDPERPDHMRLNNALEKLSKGMHSELIIAFLSRLFSDQESEPNKVAKLFISSGILPSGERIGAVSSPGNGATASAIQDRGSEENSLNKNDDKHNSVKSKLKRLGV